MTVTLYQVGGSVRDELLGVKSKDIDFAVECSGFSELVNLLFDNGFDVFLVQPEFMTARARFPRDGFQFAGQNMGGITADFVVCRTEAHYSDARHPDAVGVGTIYDDLARRDFTMNAIAKRADGSYLDPWGGRADLFRRLICAVGDPRERMVEDPLRILRALRFAITKNMSISGDLARILETEDLLWSLFTSVSKERIREELFKMFKHNTPATIEMLFTREGFETIGRNLFVQSGLWLKPTLEDR